MADTLIIVESPTKARTISRFLSKGYQVIASLGHIRDLPKSRFGISLEDDFKPEDNEAARTVPENIVEIVMIITITISKRFFI